MNRKTLFVSLLVLCLAAVATPGAIINVPGDFATIQGAIDAAGFKGDEIVVSPGTYLLTSSISFNGKAITVRSASPSGATIEGSIVSLMPLFVFNSGEGAGSVLDGFIIQSGSEGIRMENSSPTIRNCTIISSIGNGIFATNSHGVMEDCTSMANFGHGMRITGGSTIALTRCVFDGNSLGGVDNISSDPSFTDCEFIWNDDGSGVSNSLGSPSLDQCLFGGNITTVFTGGGMRSAGGSPLLTACVFAGNLGVNGGGLWCDGGSVNDCTFVNNNAMEFGAGGYFMNTILDGCAFVGNEITPLNINNSLGGGGAWAGLGAVFNNCQFASNNTPTGIGGGLFAETEGVEVRNCLFQSNTSTLGGGIYSISGGTISNTIFLQNQAGQGGGIVAGDNSGVDPLYVTNCRFLGNTADNYAGASIIGDNVTVANCEFSGNIANDIGGAMRCSGSPTIVGCTMSMNHAGISGAVMVLSGVEFVDLKSCIAWGNTGNLPHFTTSGGQITYSFSNIQGIGNNFPNIDTDPLFIDADGFDNFPGTLDDNLRLLSGSPSISTGNTAALPPDAADLDGDGNTSEPIPLDLDGIDRLVGSAVDMGAYEDQSCPADIAPFGGNGIINIDDLVLLLNAFGGCGGCVGDTTPSPGNGAVNIDDLVMILNAFGACP